MASASEARAWRQRQEARGLIGYRVYHAPEGGDLAYCGDASTLRQARRLAGGGGLPRSMWDTARAAGHVCGMTAPDGGYEDSEPCEWCGRRGEWCIVAVYDRPQD